MTIPNTRSLDPGSSQDLKSLNLKDETLASYSSDSMSTAAASLGWFSREDLGGKGVWPEEEEDDDDDDGDGDDC